MKNILGGKKQKMKQPHVVSLAASSSSSGDSRAMYRYAVEEYNQTVPYDYSSSEPPLPMAETTARRSTEAPPDIKVHENLEAAPQHHVTTIESNDSQQVEPSDSMTSTMNVNVGQYRPPLSDLPGPHFRSSRVVEPEMVDATYEEQYGDAYVGGPIKYVYPSGYQSMRPRGGPWKLSIVVCILFTWLSIFIVGHCSDRIDYSQYENNEIDDDALVIETRWCGSHLLYVLWVMSMITTGLAAAYCSVIGYIKVRDFNVANSRSQPPGMVGKSDYYVRIGENSEGTRPRLFTGDSDASYKSYQKSIYQSDGTPLFWGGHIYRPTQAAVAVTSR